MTKPIWLMVGLMQSFSAAAQPINWDQVQACAERPIPAVPSTEAGALGLAGALDPRFMQYQQLIQGIMDCRRLMAARHDGWVAAAEGRPDPLDPGPLYKPQDWGGEAKWSK